VVAERFLAMVITWVVCPACGRRLKIRIKGGAAVFLSWCPCGRLRGEKGEEERRKN